MSSIVIFEQGAKYHVAPFLLSVYLYPRYTVLLFVSNCFILLIKASDWYVSLFNFSCSALAKSFGVYFANVLSANSCNVKSTTAMSFF